MINLSLWFGACGKGAYQWSFSSHGQRIQEKEEGTRVSQSPGMTQKPPTRPDLRKLPPSLSCGTLGTKVLNTWAFGGGARGGGCVGECGGGGAIQKQIAAASLNEPKQIPDSILNTWLLNSNACLITDEKIMCWQSSIRKAYGGRKRSQEERESFGRDTQVPPPLCRHVSL